jgi:hypothetical protein
MNRGPFERAEFMRQAMPSNGPRVKHERNGGRRRDKFAERLAMIVLRWRTVYLQQPRSADPKLWMSARATGKTDTRGASE